MSELPEGWIWTTIDSISVNHDGKRIPVRRTDRAAVQGSYPYYGASGIIDSVSGYLFDGDYLLVAEDGANLLSRSTPIAFRASGKFWVNNHAHVLTTIEDIPLSYVEYYLNGLNLSQFVTGSAQPKLTQRNLNQIPIPLAPLAEQKRIADKLDALLARVDRTRARLDRVPLILKRFRQAVLAAATSGQLTEDWREGNGGERMPNIVALEDTGSTFSYGSSAKSSPTGTIPVLRMGNIQNGKLDWGDLVFTSDSEEISKYSLLPGDVLFNRTNSPELVGKTAVYKGEQPAIYAGYLIRLKCSNNLLPDYINYCLNSPAGRDYCWRVKSDGVSQSNINAKKLAAFEFDLPPLAEQHEIVRRVETLFAFADRLQARYQAAPP